MSNETPSWKLVGMTVVLAGIYASISGVGIKVFQRCEAIQSSQKWKNIKMYLSHTVTLGIAIPVVLLIQKVLGDTTQEKLLASLYCIMGFIGSAMSLALAQECPDSDEDEAAKGMGAFGIVIYLLAAIGSAAFIFKQKRNMGAI